MKAHPQHAAGGSLPGFPSTRPKHAAPDSAQRKRHSSTAMPAPGVLIHRIGDDDETGAKVVGKPPHAPAAPERRTRGAARDRRGATAVPTPSPAAAQARTAAPASGAAIDAPAYSMPRALRMACERARQVQPRLINISDASYAGAQE